MLLLLACTRHVAPDLPAGSWVLRADDTLGVLDVSSGGCRIDLSSERWGTGGPVDCESHEEPGRFVFPIQLGAGDALAVADWRGETVVVPLSTLEGWLELELAVEAGTVEVPPFSPDRAAWSDGRFLLGEEGRLDLGRGVIELYSPRLLTDGLVAFSAEERGPDLALSVLVEPSLGEPAVFLLNRPTGRIVLPGGPHPWTARLEPGWIEDTGALRQAAIREADEAEAAQMMALIAGLQPPCELPAEALAGYRVELEEAGGACSIVVEPAPEQHRRRFRYRSVVGVPER